MTKRWLLHLSVSPCTSCHTLSFIMSFSMSLRSFARQGSSSISRPGLGLQLGARRFAHQPTAVAASLRRTTSSQSPGAFTWAGPLALLAGLGLPTLLTQKPLSLESVSTSPPFTSETGLPAEVDFPKSDVNVYNLGFGTVCGICSGIFIKKGAKFIAFLLGGGFVLLQVSQLIYHMCCFANVEFLHFKSI